ncbi:MAG: hypothetical protein NTW86_01510 [Candidatus Sumerlaeota bacterium]|nr:hypothetical protein [Candidatus Sumerlaeota bacterium]
MNPIPERSCRRGRPYAGDGKWKTATFAIDAPIRPGALREGCNLILRATGMMI